MTFESCFESTRPAMLYHCDNNLVLEVPSSSDKLGKTSMSHTMTRAYEGRLFATLIAQFQCDVRYVTYWTPIRSRTEGAHVAGDDVHESICRHWESEMGNRG